MKDKILFFVFELIFIIITIVVIATNAQYLPILLLILLVGLTTSLGIVFILEKLEDIEKKLNGK